MLTYCNGPKVGIKLLKISYVRILFLVSLLFVVVTNPYSVFLNFKLLNVLVLILNPIIFPSIVCTVYTQQYVIKNE